ncbi:MULTISPECIES: hypothetical protein [Burkholderia]|uniref:Uncharacterized protein n=2 Tax=Burkholderia anthina TaxID=179879 RepID=A0A7T7AKF4_9BURK|nr:MULTISPECIES: hypothetical protein [Burkholderia]MBY4866828.1 hypothetical protein [Burkholderia anthina]QQK05940.1 hypothetical protein JFN94_18860 [Burkholderia anthina]
MTLLEQMRVARHAAAQAANVVDADIWRWFATVMEDRRIRWCFDGNAWLVSVDHRHVATDPCFDSAIRIAKSESERRMRRSERCRNEPQCSDAPSSLPI